MSATPESKYFGVAVRDWEERKARALARGDHKFVYLCDRFLAFYSVGIKPLDVPDCMFFDMKWGQLPFY